MGYQSKTYSLSDEVVEEIERQKAAGVSPDRLLWAALLQKRKPSKRAQRAVELAQSDVTAQVVGRDDIEYGEHTELPRGEHVANLSRDRGPLLKPKDKPSGGRK